MAVTAKTATPRKDHLRCTIVASFVASGLFLAPSLDSPNTKNCDHRIRGANGVPKLIRRTVHTAREERGIQMQPHDARPRIGWAIIPKSVTIPFRTNPFAGSGGKPGPETRQTGGLVFPGKR